MDKIKIVPDIEPTDPYEKAKADIMKAKTSLSKLTPNQQKALAEELFGASYVETVLKALFNNNLMR